MAKNTGMQTGGAAASQDPHNHTLSIQFKGEEGKQSFTCQQPQTVLQVIKTFEKFRQLLGLDYDKIVIQQRTGNAENIIATHFPCTCLKNDDTLIVSKTKETVEERRAVRPILPKDDYSVFYIYKVGGKNTRTKPLFKNSKVKQFKFLCVYGEKNITVQEALQQDGRFIELPEFQLSDYSDEETVIHCTKRINILNKQKFKIELPRGVWPRDPKTPKYQGALCSKQAGSGAVPSATELQELQEALRQKKKDFGKIRQAFSDVCKLGRLLERGKSVCNVLADGHSAGTGFVLVDNLIMTNAHLFKECTEKNKLKEGTDVYVLFNYENSEHPCYPGFKVEDSYICLNEDELDYAVLKVSPQGQTWSSREEQLQKPSLPPGLLEYFGEMPKNGGACIIGHPGGGVKQIDLTCVIEPKRRNQAAEYNLRSYRQSPVIFYSLVDTLKRQGIDRIMMGGDRAETGITYKTFMYYGSSGSPVFDAQGRVCALHTAGYVYRFTNTTESVIEFGQSLEIIMKHLVKTLTERNDQELLRRIWEVSDSNPFLKKFF